MHRPSFQAFIDPAVTCCVLIYNHGAFRLYPALLRLQPTRVRQHEGLQLNIWLNQSSLMFS